jgi:hypothetical protein
MHASIIFIYTLPVGALAPEASLLILFAYSVNLTDALPA